MARALVVDDEALIRLLAVDLLTELGFDVLDACDADEALDVIDHDRDWQVLFTDIRMPCALNGVQLGQRAMTLVPNLQVIYASGSPELIDRLSARERFVPKPYSLSMVGRAIDALRAA